MLLTDFELVMCDFNEPPQNEPQRSNFFVLFQIFIRYFLFVGRMKRKYYSFGSLKEEKIPVK